MNTKMRSEFWKCCNVVFETHTCHRINPSNQAICECGNDPSANGREFPPATNVEVLVAWLQASDERRREIEIASRPTKAGEYSVYFRCDDEDDARETMDCAYQVVSESNMDEVIKGWDKALWEPLT